MTTQILEQESKRHPIIDRTMICPRSRPSCLFLQVYGEESAKAEYQSKVCDANFGYLSCLAFVRSGGK